MLRVAGARTGAVLAGVVNAVGPGVIVLGGELARAKDALLDPVREALDAHVLPLARGRVTLLPAGLGEAGGALGGVALALHESPLLARYPEPGSEDLPEDAA
ncbi:ROK family protein [Streptomyces glycanivorans]|uniref:ROK family protein n=1 Tax=Streptomyces glycanivorans TaxID=3033808 RepID=A0ABY9JKB1_9ACTN|nr:ROK family protein [Streptomyces sp. Alt3]WLQ68137.1 ROK family protein [Streptomyces sp. Alt3]